MDDVSVMILGSGRLSDKLVKLFKKSNIKTVEVGSKEFKEREETEVQESSMDYARSLLIQKGIENVSSVCIVDVDDAVNIYLLMAVLAVRENMPIYAAFFNEGLVYGLAFKNKNLKIFNPAAIVSRLFVEAIPKSISRSEEVKTASTYNDNPRDVLIWRILAGFIWLMITGAIFFHFTESVSWQRSFYLVITVITSVNFNDAVLKNYDPIVDILRMSFMLATYAYVIVAFALVVEYIVKFRTDAFTLGRRRHHKRGHVIVCGLGRVGYAIVQDLIIKGEDIIVIEPNQENIYLPAVRANKISVLIGDATLPHYLIDAGIGKAKALICAINSDLINLEIGLNARSERNNIRLLLRISDQSTAEEMKKRLDIHHVFSKSFSTATSIYSSVYYRLCGYNREV